MSKGREIHCYDYVNHPYEQVRGALSKDAPAVFQSATKAAASRAQSIASELRIDIGGIGIEADIQVSVKNIEVKPREAMSRSGHPVAAGMGGRDDATPFSAHEGGSLHLSIDRTETQLDFMGVYEPPLGAAGKSRERNRRAPHRGGVRSPLR